MSCKRVRSAERCCYTGKRSDNDADDPDHGTGELLKKSAGRPSVRGALRLKAWPETKKSAWLQIRSML
jgi:hypothetical protein